MKIELPSNEKLALQNVEALVQSLLSSDNITQEQFGTILVSLSEAVSNAVIHGNKSDESKKVTLEYSFVDHFIDFSVSDEGQGYEIDVMQNEEFFEKENRGLALIQKLTDGIEFNESRSSIQMRFDLTSAQAKLNNQRSSLLQTARQQVLKGTVINKNQHV